MATTNQQAYFESFSGVTEDEIQIDKTLCSFCHRSKGFSCTRRQVKLAGRRHGFLWWRQKFEKSGTQNFCYECGTPDGGYHHVGCTKEICPRCGGYLCACGCVWWKDGSNEDR